MIKNEVLDWVLPPKDAAQLLGISLTTLWRISNLEPSFPPKVQISERRTGWMYSDLIVYIESKTLRGATLR